MRTPFPTQADLIAEELACRRGDRLVFVGLSCRIPSGGVLLLTGSNGSGKSSLLRLLATLLRPTAGRLCWGGVPVTADIASYRTAIHYVGHLDALKPALTARETLAFWAAQRGATAASLESALAAFGLDRVAEWPCRWLSAGQRRRLALARLIAAPAPVWFLDEPNAGLDHAGEASLETTIARHRAAGGRAVIATHASIDAPAAATLLLDDFAPGPADVSRDSWAAAF
jgi:heme exporter protein A